MGDPLDAAFERLPQVTSVGEVHALINAVTSEVERRTPCMLCDPGCSECCRHQVTVGYAEWAHALAWIQRNLSREEQRAVVRRAEDLLGRPGGAIQTWMSLNGLDGDSAAYRETVDDTFSNTDTPCPFLVGGRCSIYQARPSICRAYGRTMRTEDDAYYCDRIMKKAEEWPDGLEDIELPVFQGYHHAVLTLRSDDLDQVNLLPIWVLSHRGSDGGLADQAFPIDRQSPFPGVDGYWAYEEGE